MSSPYVQHARRGRRRAPSRPWSAPSTGRPVLHGQERRLAVDERMLWAAMVAGGRRAAPHAWPSPTRARGGSHRRRTSPPPQTRYDDRQLPRPVLGDRRQQWRCRRPPRPRSGHRRTGVVLGAASLPGGAVRGPRRAGSQVPGPGVQVLEVGRVSRARSPIRDGGVEPLTAPVRVVPVRTPRCVRRTAGGSRDGSPPRPGRPPAAAVPAPRTGPTTAAPDAPPAW